VTFDAPRLAKEKQRASLLIFRQRIPLTACEPVDRRVGKHQREFKLGDGKPKHVKADWFAVAN
jgi:hypothetical protein